MRTSSIILLSCFLICVGLNACIKSDAFEKNNTLTMNKWKSSYKPEYTFDISDTTISYSMFLTIRHTDAYPFSNIWLNIRSKSPGDSIFKTFKIEVPLAEEKGKWLGRGMNEIWEQQLPISIDGAAVHFSKKGMYTIQLEQIMRVDPLPEVMSIGIRLEKNQTSNHSL